MRRRDGSLTVNGSSANLFNSFLSTTSRPNRGLLDIASITDVFSLRHLGVAPAAEVEGRRLGALVAVACAIPGTHVLLLTDEFPTMSIADRRKMLLSTVASQGSSSFPHLSLSQMGQSKSKPPMHPRGHTKDYSSSSQPDEATNPHKGHGAVKQKKHDGLAFFTKLVSMCPLPEIVPYGSSGAALGGTGRRHGDTMRSNNSLFERSPSALRLPIGSSVPGVAGGASIGTSAATDAGKPSSVKYINAVAGPMTASAMRRLILFAQARAGGRIVALKVGDHIDDSESHGASGSGVSSPDTTSSSERRRRGQAAGDNRSAATQPQLSELPFQFQMLSPLNASTSTPNPLHFNIASPAMQRLSNEGLCVIVLQHLEVATSEVVTVLLEAMRYGAIRATPEEAADGQVDSDAKGAPGAANVTGVVYPIPCVRFVGVSESALLYEAPLPAALREAFGLSTSITPGGMASMEGHACPVPEDNLHRLLYGSSHCGSLLDDDSFVYCSPNVGYLYRQLLSATQMALMPYSQQFTRIGQRHYYIVRVLKCLAALFNPTRLLIARRLQGASQSRRGYTAGGIEGALGPAHSMPELLPTLNPEPVFPTPLVRSVVTPTDVLCALPHLLSHLLPLDRLELYMLTHPTSTSAIANSMGDGHSLAAFPRSEDDVSSELRPSSSGGRGSVGFGAASTFANQASVYSAANTFSGTGTVLQRSAQSLSRGGSPPASNQVAMAPSGVVAFLQSPAHRLGTDRSIPALAQTYMSLMESRRVREVMGVADASHPYSIDVSLLCPSEVWDTAAVIADGTRNAANTARAFDDRTRGDATTHPTSSRADQPGNALTGSEMSLTTSAPSRNAKEAVTAQLAAVGQLAISNNLTYAEVLAMVCAWTAEGSEAMGEWLA